jgi:hypothetical protein
VWRTYLATTCQLDLLSPSVIDLYTLPTAFKTAGSLMRGISRGFFLHSLFEAVGLAPPTQRMPVRPSTSLLRHKKSQAGAFTRQ